MSRLLRYNLKAQALGIGNITSCSAFLAVRIVSLIGLGPSHLTRNSGLASTQTLTLGSIFAAALHC